MVGSSSSFWIRPAEFEAIVRGGQAYLIPSEQRQLCQSSYQALLTYLNSSENQLLYGIDTGFGPHAFQNNADRKENQISLVYHLSVQGQEQDICSAEESRSVFLCRLHSLAQGKSSISPELLALLESCLELDFIPILPKKGSLSASGDLVPLSLLALSLQGEGSFFFKGKQLSLSDSQTKAKELKLPIPYLWKPKEALSLTNGTSFTTGIFAMQIFHSLRLFERIVEVLEFFFSFFPVFPGAFHPNLVAMKQHQEARRIAERLFPIIEKNSKKKQSGKRIQDVYSVRCIPQILGAVVSEWKSCLSLVEEEWNSVSDNPVWDFPTNQFWEGGLFYGSEVSFAIDRWNTASVSLGNWIERLFQYLTLPELNERYPLMLSPEPGRYAGLSGLGLLATHLVADMRRDAHPASVQSLVTNGNNQDVVPMGAIGLERNRRTLESLCQLSAILAIAMVQAQSWEKKLGHFPKEGKGNLSEKKEGWWSKFVPLEKDRPLAEDLRLLVMEISRFGVSPIG